MTIVTKAGLLEDEEKKDNVKNEAMLAASTPTDIPPPPAPTFLPSSTNTDVEWALYYAERRRRMLRSLCLTLLLLWLLMATFVGGMILYRLLHRRPVYYGWCGTSFDDEDHNGRMARLNQRVQIDQDELYEEIEVPKFGPNRPAIFIHDFRQNLTAIADLFGNRCFIKSLDTAHVAPPKSFIDLIEKLEDGYYDQNPAVIRQNYQVGDKLTREQLGDLHSFMISKQCRMRDTYMLNKVYRLEHTRMRSKRETGKQHLRFAVMDGETVEINDVEF